MQSVMCKHTIRTLTHTFAWIGNHTIIWSQGCVNATRWNYMLLVCRMKSQNADDCRDFRSSNIMKIEMKKKLDLLHNCSNTFDLLLFCVSTHLFCNSLWLGSISKENSILIALVELQGANVWRSPSRISHVWKWIAKIDCECIISNAPNKGWIELTLKLPNSTYLLHTVRLTGAHCVRAYVVRFYATFNYEPFWLIWLWPSNLNGSLKKQFNAHSRYIWTMKEKKTSWTMKTIWMFLGFIKR